MGKLVQWTLAFTLLIYEMKNCFPFTALLNMLLTFTFFTIFIGIMFTLIHNDDDGDDDDNTNNNNHNNNTSIL